MCPSFDHSPPCPSSTPSSPQRLWFSITHALALTSRYTESPLPSSQTVTYASALWMMACNSYVDGPHSSLWRPLSLLEQWRLTALSLFCSQQSLPHFTIRSRTHIGDGEERIKYMTVTCLLCNIQVYRVHIDNPEIDGPDGPILPVSQEWREPGPFQHKDRHVDVSAACLVRA